MPEQHVPSSNRAGSGEKIKISFRGRTQNSFGKRRKIVRFCPLWDGCGNTWPPTYPGMRKTSGPKGLAHVLPRQHAGAQFPAILVDDDSCDSDLPAYVGFCAPAVSDT